MSDSIHYRLSYLNGRLHAYEREEDLKNLVMQSKELKTKQRNSKTNIQKNAYTIKDKDDRDTIP